MNQATTRWLADVRVVALKAKYFIRAWVAAHRYWAQMAAGDPRAFGGEACKNKVVESAASQAAFFKARAAQAIGEAKLLGL